MVPVTGTKLFVVVEASVEERALERLLADGDSAVVLFALRPGSSPEPARLKPLVEMAQAKGVAALIEADAQLARTLRADGVHLPWSKDVVTHYGQAREVLGERFIVGADAGRLRDDAMMLGEAGADYVGFGIPPHLTDRETARERRLELIAWWSEIFEVPCVGFDVETLAEAATLARAGADFVAFRMPADAEPSRWVREAAGALGARENVA
jgi:thiamine-phosphate pyrophosphorylase